MTFQNEIRMFILKLEVDLTHLNLHRVVLKFSKVQRKHRELIKINFQQRDYFSKINKWTKIKQRIRIFKLKYKC